MVDLGRVPHRHAQIEYVAVPPSLALPGDVAGLDEVGDDPLRRTLGNAHSLGDIP